MLKKIITIFLFFVLPTFAISQIDIRKKGTKDKSQEDKKPETSQISEEKKTGIIKGKILDKSDGQGLMGVKVSIKNTDMGAISDYEGKFMIENVPFGEYILVVSCIGYQTKEIKEVKIEKNKENLPLFITLEEVGVDIQEVVIQSSVRQESEASAILIQKMNLNISDVFSGDLIMRSSADLFINTALTRMPGVALIEDRYLVIRGMPERYNLILLNGSLLPVIKIDRQAYDFNNLPSNMISQLQLVKSYSTNLPGTFGSGLIAFQTKGIPDQNSIQINYQTAYNTFSTFQEGIFPKLNGNGKLGFFKNIPPYLPNDFPSPYEVQNLPIHSQENAELGRKVNATFQAIPNQLIRPNQSLALQINRKYTFQNHGILGISISSNILEENTIEKQEVRIFEDFDDSLAYNPVSDSSQQTIYKNIQTFNQVFNLGYQSNLWKLEWKNYFSKTRWVSFLEQNGIFNYENITWYDYICYRNKIEFQDFFNSNFQAEGILFKKNHSQLTLKASAFANFANYKMPSWNNIYLEWNDSTGKYHMTNEFLEDYSDLIFSMNVIQNQKDRLLGSNFSWDFQKQWNKLHTRFELGVFISSQFRNFQNRNIGITPTNADSTDLDLTQYSYSNYTVDFPTEDIRPYGFTLRDITLDHNNYTANAFNWAPFLLNTWNWNNQFQISAGLRLETYHINLYSNLLNGNKQTLVFNTLTDLLPCFLMNYSLKEDMKLKFSISQSIARPELREISKVEYFDFNTSVFWGGNPYLKRTKITNFDLRWEWFQHGNNLLSTTLFYKYLQYPIEQTLKQGDLVYVNIYEMANADKAYNLGWETEFRQTLGQSNYLQNFKIYGNFMLQTSQVTDNRTGNTTRPIQGQTPYLINLGILFSEPHSKINFDLFFNRSGKQIVLIGAPGKFDNLYLLPRNKIDIQVSRNFENGFSTKLAVLDIFNQPYIRRQYYESGFYQDNLVTKIGRIITFALQYKF